MRLLVCGSRTFANPDPNVGNPRWRQQQVFAWSVLQGIYEMESIGYLLTHVNHLTVIEGAAPGADTCAHEWATTPGPHPAAGPADWMLVLNERYPAVWTRHGKRAGYVRNQQMLDEGKPELVVAFYDGLERSRGTQMMTDIARKAGVETWELFS